MSALDTGGRFSLHRFNKEFTEMVLHQPAWACYPMSVKVK